MPKVSDKGTKRKSIDDTNTSRNSNANSQSTKKRKEHPKVEKIAKSKQLAAKQKSNNKSRKNTVEGSKPRICGNGKPMPSLAELEKMYEDSDDEISLVTNSRPRKHQTLGKQVVPREEVLPKTLQDLSLKLITNAIEPSEPHRKKNNNDSCIVSMSKCKQHKKTKEKAKPEILNENRSLDGADVSESIRDENNITQIQYESSPIATSNKADNFVEMLKETDNVETHSDGSVDSNKTLNYDFSAISPTNHRPQSFSPLPSTSKDKETFLKNDIRFNESLLMQNEVEVIEIPCETIILDDDEDMDVNACLQITHSCPEEEPYSIEPIDLDYYSPFGLNQSLSSGDCEIIDVDNVIAENRAITEKYKDRSISEPVNVLPNQSFCNMEPNNIKKDRGCDYECDDSVQPRQNEIAKVVQNFFAKPDNLNSHVNDINSKLVTKPSLLRDIANYFVQCTQTVLNSFRTHNNESPQVPAIERNICPIEDLHDNSVELMSESAPETNNINTPHDSSVIFVSSTTLDNTVSTDQERNKRHRSKKSTTASIAASVKTPPSTNDTQYIIGECPICMENYLKRTAAATICGHVFCMKCIQAAIKANGKRCPTCRRDLKGKCYQQLFFM